MKKFLLKNIVFSTIKDINSIIFPHHKKKIVLMIFLILFGGVLDVLGLAAILPVATLIFDPTNIHKSAFIHSVFVNLGFESDNAFLYFILICFWFVFLFKNAAAAIISFLQSRYSYSVATDISQKQFENIMNHDLQYFNDHNSTNLVRNIQIMPFHFSTYLLLPTLILMSEIVVLIIILVAISLYNITVIGLMVVTLTPSFILTYKLIKSRTQFYEKERNRLNTELTKQAYQTIHGYIDVKLFNKEKYFMGVFKLNQIKFKRVFTNSFTLNLIPSKIIELTAISAVIIMFAYTLFSPSARESISIMLPLFIAAAYRVMPSMNRMLIALGSIKGFQYVIQIIKDGLQPIPNTSENNNDVVLDFNENIEFRAVSYRYPSGNKLSVDSLNLKVLKGQKVGIIGKSGSGKTTIINILLRFLKEQQGGLYIDNKQVTVQEENQWRQLIGYVKQSVFIIDGNFYENIAFGVPKEDIDIDKLNRVLKLSKLDEVVDKSPQGLNSNIGENGTKLSGGQRQRIAIARALYKEAQILVFDEATSALDTQTEKEITESIEAISKENKTMFIIAHRITTLKNCDVIYEMADGKIIGTYTYDEIAKTILEN
jgi:ABC-type multidrug transport system fused ATPase/permease subunit